MHALHCTLKVVEVAWTFLDVYAPVCGLGAALKRLLGSESECVCALVWLWFINVIVTCSALHTILKLFGERRLFLHGVCLSLSLCVCVCVCVSFCNSSGHCEILLTKTALHTHTHTHTLNATDAGQRNSKWWHVSHVRANRFSHMKVTGCF